MLAAGARALLRADRPLERRRLVADEVRLERHHAGDVEQHRRVVRDQAGRGDRRVAACGEEVDERLAELVGGARGAVIGAGEPTCGPRTGPRVDSVRGAMRDDRPTISTSGSASRTRPSSGRGCSTPRSCARTTAASTAPGARACSTADATELEQGCCSYGAHFVDDDDVQTSSQAFVRLTPDADGSSTTRRREAASCARRARRRRRRADRHPPGRRCVHLPQPARLRRRRRLRAAHRAPSRPASGRSTGSRTCAGSCRCGSSTRPTRTATSRRRLREWKRRDWGEGGAEFHWWCTESPEAFVGDRPVYQDLARRDRRAGRPGHLRPAGRAARAARLDPAPPPGPAPLTCAPASA